MYQTDKHQSRGSICSIKLANEMLAQNSFTTFGGGSNLANKEKKFQILKNDLLILCYL